MSPENLCPSCGGACAWQLVGPNRWEGSCYGECGGYPVVAGDGGADEAVVFDSEARRSPDAHGQTTSNGPGCSSELPAGLITFDHARILHSELGRSLSMVADLDLAVTRQTSFGPTYGAGGRSAGETPLYWDEGAGDARRWIQQGVSTIQFLMSQCRCTTPYLQCERPVIAHKHHYGLASQIAWLQDHITLLIGQRVSSVESLILGLQEANEAAYSAIDSPRPRIYLGDCSCGARLYADPESTEYECPSCAAVHDPSELRIENQREGERSIVTAAEARKYIGEYLGVALTKGRFNNWTRRGLIRSTGTNPDTGEKYYVLGDITAHIRRVAEQSEPKSVRT